MTPYFRHLLHLLHSFTCHINMLSICAPYVQQAAQYTHATSYYTCVWQLCVTTQASYVHAHADVHKRTTCMTRHDMTRHTTHTRHTHTTHDPTFWSPATTIKKADIWDPTTCLSNWWKRQWRHCGNRGQRRKSEGKKGTKRRDNFDKQASGQVGVCFPSIDIEYKSRTFLAPLRHEYSRRERHFTFVLARSVQPVASQRSHCAR